VLRVIIIAFLLVLVPELVLAGESDLKLSPDTIRLIDLTATQRGLYCVVIFVIAYIAVMMEDFTHLRKSKPVILAAGIIWAQVAYLAIENGVPVDQLHAILTYNLAEYAELMLFLLVAMTYINSMTERNVFEALRSWLVSKRFGYRKLFWITGILTFFLSAIADNLTSALLIGSVVMAVGASCPRFVTLGLINLVIAANAGGTFSPFGDITTLMVWQAGKAQFFEFFALFIPSLVNYLVPAMFMCFAIPDKTPEATAEQGIIAMKRGALGICGLFALTIIIAVSFKLFLHLPPFVGMMVGLSFLMFYGYYLRNVHGHGDARFDIFTKVAHAEWDTLLFFYGVVLAVGGLSYLGYLELMSVAMYHGLGATTANILVGVLSAIVDNIPVMFAVLRMSPDMDLYQWLLVTLSAGVGGSMLSIGSAAGIALMGVSNGKYSFISHLKWAPVIALGYITSILTHYMVNA